MAACRGSEGSCAVRGEMAKEKEKWQDEEAEWQKHKPRDGQEEEGPTWKWKGLEGAESGPRKKQKHLPRRPGRISQDAGLAGWADWAGQTGWDPYLVTDLGTPRRAVS